MISTCNTIPKLAIAVAEIEDKCQFERLNPEFLLQRMSFHYNLLFYADVPILYPTKERQNREVGLEEDTSVTITQRSQLAHMSLKRVVFAINHLRNNIAKVVPEDVDIKIAISEALLRKHIPAQISSIIYSFLDVENADGIRSLDEFITKELKHDFNFSSKSFKFTGGRLMMHDISGALRELYGSFMPSGKVDHQIERALASYLPIHALNIKYVSANVADLNHLFDAPENLAQTLICRSTIWTCTSCFKKCSTEEPPSYKKFCPSCTHRLEEERAQSKAAKDRKESAHYADHFVIKKCIWHPACHNAAPKYRDTCRPCNNEMMKDKNWKHPKFEELAAAHNSADGDLPSGQPSSQPT
jgi:hypothetical protein